MLLARGFLISLVFFVSRQELLVLCPGTRNFVGYVGPVMFLVTTFVVMTRHAAEL